MKTAQSPHIPSEGTKPGWSDLPWLVPFALRGFVELVRARAIFARLEARDIPKRNRAAREDADPASAVAPDALARISYVLPRLSDRLPWRSDCLVQAIAAQNWLSSLGVAGEIQIGVEHPEGGAFGAHAWLLYDRNVITGGDIERYRLLLGDRDTRNESGD